MQSSKPTRRALLGEIGRGMLTRLRSMTERLRGRDPEVLGPDFIMGINRLVAGCTMLVIMALLSDHALLNQWAIPVVIWTGCALGIIISLQLGKRLRYQRRSLAVVLDVAGATIMLAAGGEETAFLYAVYLWIIIGNGFRFGGRFMLAASLLSIIGFSTLVLTDPFWQSHFSLSAGLLIGLAVLPAYSFGLIRQLAQARKRAEQADAAKSLFLAGVSHELRTPLHAIMATVELMQGTRLDGVQANMLATINTAADGQLSLVQDVLEFSRIEAGYGHAAVESFDLLDVLTKTTSLIAVSAHGKGLLVNLYVTARTPLRLRGVERYIREVLLNLGGNAIKFTSKGSVTIAADGYDIGGGLTRLRIEVVDTGIGVAPENQKRIFSLFTQADGGVFNRFGGTGLGLALCERQVRLMNGAIGVESVPGAGSTFWFELDLPLEEDKRSQPAAHMIVQASCAGWVRSLQDRLASTGTSDPAGVHISLVEGTDHNQPPSQGRILIRGEHDVVLGLPSREIRERFATSISQHSSFDDLHRAVRIAASHPKVSPRSAVRLVTEALPQIGGPLVGLLALVADDNALNRSVLSRLLERAGLRVMLANDGEEALTLLTGSDIDLAFIDVNMPVIDGIELAGLYAFTSSNNRRTPLIGLTADGSKETQARCLQAGMKACLVKPVRSAELIAAAEDVLADRVPTPIASLESNLESDRPSRLAPTMDAQTLSDLEALGGTEFLQQLLSDFRHDGHSLVELLGVAHAGRNVHDFRFNAHSLSSISANIGARKLRALCLRWSKISEDALDRDGDLLIADLRHEWDEVLGELDNFNTAGPSIPVSSNNGQRFG